MIPDLVQLRDRLGDDQTIYRYISMFIRDMPDILHQMEEALAVADWEEGSRWAHTFRAQMLMIDHAMAAASAAQMEVECQKVEPDEILLGAGVLTCRRYLDETIALLRQVNG